MQPVVFLESWLRFKSNTDCSGLVLEEKCSTLILRQCGLFQLMVIARINDGKLKIHQTV